MNISREHAEAFLALCRKKTFSSAAEALHITQAAFSIRIQRLEEELQHTLAIRNKSGMTLTEAGKKFLQYCEMIEGLEKEFLDDFKEDDKRLNGTIRLGTFSTIGRSVVLPSMAKMLKENSDIQFSYQMKELSELPDLLMRSEIDFVLLDQPFKSESVVSILLGEEEYVHITAVGAASNQDVFLNHDEKDMMSYKYFDFIGAPKQQLKRRYLDEIYSVIDGVANGWGVSVLPEHLIRGDKRIKIVNQKKKLLSPVYLCFRIKPYYSRTFRTVQEILVKEIPKRLKAK